MFARIKNVFKKWKADRQQLRELLIKLDGLTNTELLHQHELENFELPKYNAIYGKQR